MEKIIIHNHTKDTSYAFTLAEMGFKLYANTNEALNGLTAKYQLDGHEITVRPNDKSVTISVREKK